MSIHQTPLHQTRSFFKRSTCSVFIASILLMNSSSVLSQTSNDSSGKEHPLLPAIKHVQQSLKLVSSMKDYQAYFQKQELVGRKMTNHNATVKVRHSPFSVYMQFHKPNEGREVLYVQGRNQGKLLAHDTGIRSLVGTIALNPNSQEALSESRFPITEFGMKRMLEMLISQWQQESKFGECDVKYFRKVMLGTIECRMIQSTHPYPRKQFPSHITRIYLDNKTNLPVRVEHYGFPQAGQKPPLLGLFQYTSVRSNLGLTDIAFDQRNPQYRF